MLVDADGKEYIDGLAGSGTSCSAMAAENSPRPREHLETLASASGYCGSSNMRRSSLLSGLHG